MRCSVSPTLELIGRRQLGWSGETRNITCIGKALPVPSMNWYRGEQYLHDGDTYRITNERSAGQVVSTLSVRHWQILSSFYLPRDAIYDML